MKFQKGKRRPFNQYEPDLVNYWRENKIFEKSVNQRPLDSSYVFYDGPPFITGVPHYGTLLSSIVKDAVPRYWTMKGKRVERVWGWDCHGLPAEVYTEQKLGVKDKRDVYRIGLEKYIIACRENMIQTGSVWEKSVDQIGRWVNFKGAYKTMDNDYMESVWWAFKKLYDDGKIYEGERVLLYCTRDATPLSKAEIAQDNSYQEVTDPSVYVKFKLAERSRTYLLAWTTTPWTLLANTALAINESLEYAEVKVDNDVFIMAADLVDKVLKENNINVVTHTIIKKYNGKELLGLSYEPLFENRGKNAHKIYNADYVSLEEGTGIVHIAPAYGEEDYELAKKRNIPVMSVVDDDGLYSQGEWRGQNIWEANKLIAKTLYERDIVWKIEYIQHSYPHCYRCGTRLMYRAHPSWFVNIDQQRELMLEQNNKINWFPTHFKEGRFNQTLLTAPEWNISRDRFWATPIPVWKGKDNKGKEIVKVIGSYDELEQLSGKRLKDYHRPWIDEVSFELDGIKMQRIDKVLDCWFESGSMPFAQFHYPFENQQKFEDNFPGDFIAEHVGQIRGWFYSLHAISVGLFNKPAFYNVIVTGTIMGNDGRKMSKSYGNFTDPEKLINLYGADSLRYLLLSSPVMNGEDFIVLDKDVIDVSRRLSMIWNMYDFFTLYASVDKWEASSNLVDPYDTVHNLLDKWIISRLHQLIINVDTSMQKYDFPQALKPIMVFIDDASNWYVRRSRKRFWKSTNDADKNEAYLTLYYILVQLAIIMAPFTPFLAEELYCLLTGKESVHLCDWPQSGRVNETLISEMTISRELITQGLAQRAKAGIKVRQPLARAIITIPSQFIEFSDDELVNVIADELNVKEITTIIGKEALISIDTKLTKSLQKEGLAREIIRHIQQTRKDAGLNVEDRINLVIDSQGIMLKDSINEYKSIIMQETLAMTIGDNITGEMYSKSLEINGENITIKMVKQ
ncbi:MAG TPA: isoleucine--tRNA ligase [Candidatus Saccharimonadales bacterium]|jgi:isoleucyl-tRNA synthetase|nr:isoleucine--tRNA ligase [Candidatus Saccharimonadales bacterium]